ncbi:hypothetical protein N4P33_02775 [Streptomyces sp. 15-116A]|nr:hypothetical protein [Streptomyces sp. 15-116A]MCT7351101.1 hypothetical protein [Streptomyces sp. 15-116A]
MVRTSRRHNSVDDDIAATRQLLMSLSSKSRALRSAWGTPAACRARVLST